MNCAIVIPVYKDCPNDNEIKSFKQLLKILSHYPILLVTHKELDLSVYLSMGLNNNVEVGTEFFNKEFFINISSYNKLCMDVSFYCRFQKYNFILLYQLDCYVFKDELEYWCSKSYDYIGAPWFSNHESYEEGACLMSVGNGGFSLRKIDTFVKVLSSKGNAYTFIKSYKLNKLIGGNLFVFLRMILRGYKNNISWLIKEWDDAEDIFFCQVLDSTRFRLNKPDAELAINFSFEKSPSYLFLKNHNKLPFGCHAWEKYQFDSFWFKYIN